MQTISRKSLQLTGSDAKDIPLLLSGNIYLDRQQQQATLSGEFAKNFRYSHFLKRPRQGGSSKT
jgi:taurine transport system substrate-binding protein